MFESILVPLDGSPYAESVLSYVVLFARTFNAPVTLLHIIDLEQYIPSWRVPASGQTLHVQYEKLVAQLPAITETAAHVYLQQQSARLREQGIATSEVVRHGKPAEVLAAYGDGGGERPGLLAMCTHGRSGLGRVVLGSVADRLLRTAAVPLLLVHPSDRTAEMAAEIRQIVVALDGSHFAEAVVPYVQEAALHLDIPVHLVQVLPTLARVYLGTQIEVYPPDILEEVEGAAHAYLGRVASRLRRSGVRVETHVLQGEADSAIIRFGDERQGSLLALTTHGRSGLGRWMLGSVADKVVRSSHDPVLVIHPTQGETS